MKIQISFSSGHFRYALVNRPVGIGCCPKDFIAVEQRPAVDAPHYDVCRHGIVVYARRLTDAETKSFELAYLAQGKDLEDIAKSVADKMGRYASSYLEMSEEKDNRDFLSTVHDFVKKVSTGFVPSVGDLRAFSLLVVSELKKK